VGGGLHVCSFRTIATGRRPCGCQAWWERTFGTDPCFLVGGGSPLLEARSLTWLQALAVSAPAFLAGAIQSDYAHRLLNSVEGESFPTCSNLGLHANFETVPYMEKDVYISELPMK
jgi:hypothetical protein